jgi:hypothetical protein
MVHKRDVLTNYLSFVSTLNWLNGVEVMKQWCNVTVVGFIQELKQQFLAQDIMNATSVIYLQFWV